MKEIVIYQCATDDDFSMALKITKDYTKWLGIDLSFQNIESEFANFSSIYSMDSRGIFLLSKYDERLAGGIGLREFGDDIAEMKRLFVYEEFRGLHIGEQLVARLILEAKSLGYKKIRLDTLLFSAISHPLFNNLNHSLKHRIVFAE